MNKTIRADIIAQLKAACERERTGHGRSLLMRRAIQQLERDEETIKSMTEYLEAATGRIREIENRAEPEDLSEVVDDIIRAESEANVMRTRAIVAESLARRQGDALEIMRRALRMLDAGEVDG